MGTHPIFESDFDCLTDCPKGRKMGNIFNNDKKKPKSAQSSRITDLDRAVLGLKKQRDQLMKMQKQIEKDEIKTKELARKLLADKKKEKALKLLKRKKAIEKRYNHCETNIENIQGLIDQIKETQQQQDILKALDGGNQAMKELHKIVSVDDAERIMDEAAEQQAQVSEIDKLISTSITDADEVELEAELDMLIGTVSKEDLPDIPVNLEVDLPSVPIDGVAETDTPTQEEKN